MKAKVSALFAVFLFGLAAFGQPADTIPPPKVISFSPKMVFNRELRQAYLQQVFFDTATARAGSSFKYGRQGLSPHAFYNRDDRAFVGLNYKWFRVNDSATAFRNKHVVYVRYSINQQAFSFGYDGAYNIDEGKWNFTLHGNYDFVRWTNFQGLGNKTTIIDTQRRYYRMRTRDVLLSIGVQHTIGRQSSFSITPFFQYVHLLVDKDRFLSEYKTFNGNNLYKKERQHFGGIRGELQLQSLNSTLLPTRGIVFNAVISPVKNFNQPKSFVYYSAYNRLYLPLSPRFILSVENGAETVTGNPEFYQLPTLGGSKLRGYRGNRFWAETVYHNNNELQYVFDAPPALFTGKLGFLVFADQGRVWKRGEVSNLWHRGYGAGFIIAPRKKAFISFQYGISREDRTFHFQLRRSI